MGPRTSPTSPPPSAAHRIRSGPDAAESRSGSPQRQALHRRRPFPKCTVAAAWGGGVFGRCGAQFYVVRKRETDALHTARLLTLVLPNCSHAWLASPRSCSLQYLASHAGVSFLHCSGQCQPPQQPQSLSESSGYDLGCSSVLESCFWLWSSSSASAGSVHCFITVRPKNV